MKRFKKWNWSSFLFMIVFCVIGLLSNKTINDVSTFFISWLIFGIPAGLLFAYMGKDD